MEKKKSRVQKVKKGRPQIKEGPHTKDNCVRDEDTSSPRHKNSAQDRKLNHWKWDRSKKGLLHGHGGGHPKKNK